jgi:hypothetical protein
LKSESETGYELVPLSSVSGIEKPVPGDWIRNGAIPVKDEFFNYLGPLIGNLVPYCDPFSAERIY